MWDELNRGAIGAIVLVDTRRLADSFSSIDFFEDRKVPYVVAVNLFDLAPRHDPDEIRDALTLSPDVPLVLCDARSRESVKEVLVTLVEYVVNEHRSGRSAVTSGRRRS
jgi:signal recognition particle receptor subunit beta